MKVTGWFKQNYWLVIILFVAAVLRFYKADFQSLWLDETLTMKDSDPSLTLKQFYDGIMFWEFIPHLYYFILKYVFSIFGYTSLVARIYSGIIGIVGVYSVYLLGKELISKRGGLLAAALMSVNIFHIMHSQEIRPYGLLLLFTVLSFYRLSIYLKNPIRKNAIYYGLFAGLIIHAHFFGFITIFSQCAILLFFFILCNKEKKKSFFINSLIAGITLIITIIPIFQPIMRVSGITSFWLQRPGNEPFTSLFREFFGNAESVLFLINLLVIFFAINLFKQKIKNYSYNEIVSNRIIFTFIILSFWLSISMIIPILRTYLDVPMILSRYFINLIPVLIIAIAFGLDLLKNSIARYTVIILFVIASLIDIIVVKDYYNTVTKTQFRELSETIKKRNKDKSKIVSFWHWNFSYYFHDDPETKVVGSTLEDFVEKLKNGTQPQEAFWYADANSRVYTLSPENEAYLLENYTQRGNLEYFDAWAKYYVPKNAAPPVAINSKHKLSKEIFRTANFDDNGNMVFYENTNYKSRRIALEKGNYELVIKGNSFPQKPINNENAHIIVKLNGNEIANFYLSEDSNKQEQRISFANQADSGSFQIIYDNDILEKGQDRNAVIYSIEAVKK